MYGCIYTFPATCVKGVRYEQTFCFLETVRPCRIIWVEQQKGTMSRIKRELWAELKGKYEENMKENKIRTFSYCRFMDTHFARCVDVWEQYKETNMSRIGRHMEREISAECVLIFELNVQYTYIYVYSQRVWLCCHVVEKIWTEHALHVFIRMRTYTYTCIHTYVCICIYIIIQRQYVCVVAQYEQGKMTRSRTCAHTYTVTLWVHIYTSQV